VALSTIQNAVEQLAATGSVTKAAEDFIVEAEMEGPSAREPNRTLLSALRKVQMKATLREWVSSDKTAETFFDYTLRKRSRLCGDAACAAPSSSKRLIITKPRPYRREFHLDIGPWAPNRKLAGRH
jgi:hypothetical protein